MLAVILPGLLTVYLLTACSTPPTNLPSSLDTGSTPTTAPAPTSIPTATAAPALPTAAPTELPPTQPAPTAAPVSLFLSPALPESVRSAVSLPQGWVEAPQAASADLRLEISSERIIGYWTFALAAPFPTILDGVSSTALKQAWAGQDTLEFKSQPLLLSPATQAVLAAWWGEPAAGAVQLMPEAELSAYAWEHRKDGPCAAPGISTTVCSPVIIPFQDLKPDWKALQVDGASPLQKTFDPQIYPLNAPISLVSSQAENQDLLAQVETPTLTAASSNRNPAKMTVVALTGVTAMGRATAWLMEQKGILYPGQDVRGLLRSADIAHISNEVPFDPTCPKANPDEQARIVFCSPPSFMALIEDVGADVIELDGDHMMDRGPEAFMYTLELYKEHNLPYYGGGANLAEGSLPVKFEINGNKIAFVGCNAKPPGGYATAAENFPGAAHCFLDDVANLVGELKAEGYQVIVTFQHNERYLYTVAPKDRPDYLRMVEAGAVIVQGSQAHQPHNFELYQGALIHYGIGNLFFDQVNIVDVGGQRVADRAFITQHIFYNGAYLGAEVFTIQFVDFARPRFMTPAERALFLELMFKAGGW